MARPKKITEVTEEVNNNAYMAIEGLDGSGKTTICKTISRLNKDILIVQEPFSIKATQSTTEQEFYNDRLELLKYITPYLKCKKVVISDRCLLSTLTYQGRNSEHRKDILELHKNIIWPSRIIALIGCPYILHKRIKSRTGNPTYFDRNLHSYARTYELSINDMERFAKKNKLNLKIYRYNLYELTLEEIIRKIQNLIKEVYATIK